MREPFPWATREQLIGRLYNLIDEDTLSPADRQSVIDEIAVLSSPEEPETVQRRAQAAARIRSLAPGLWRLGQPLLQTILSTEVQQALQQHSH